MKTKEGATCVLYDFLQVRGGAERVSLLLSNQLSADLIVHAVDGRRFPSSELERVTPLSAHPVSASRSIRGASAWRAFLRLSPQPGVRGAIFSGHYAPLAARAFPDARRVLYLHGPPLPFHFDREDPAMLRVSVPLRAAMRLPMRALARRYLDAVAHMHDVFANSAPVAAAFERATGRQASVLHPPVDPRFFDAATSSRGYWISMARHEPVKRVDRVIDAFLGMPEQTLVLAGEGSQTPALMQRAAGAPHIRFVGGLDTPDLARWLAGARASIHVSHAEPFGLAMAESLAAGVPVLACEDSGAAELVVSGRNGQLLAADPNACTLREAVQAFDCPRHDDAGGGGPYAMDELRVERFAAVLQQALDASAGSGPDSGRMERRTTDA